MVFWPKFLARATLLAGRTVVSAGAGLLFDHLKTVSKLKVRVSKIGSGFNALNFLHICFCCLSLVRMGELNLHFHTETRF